MDLIRLVDKTNLDLLYENIKKSKNLYLSPKIKSKQLGRPWEIIQFICSWKKEHDEVSIILDNQLNLEKLNYQDPMLLTAVYLADEVRYKDENKKNELLEKFIPFVENMNNTTLYDYLRNIRGREMNFLFLGGAKNEFLHFFYNDRTEFRTQKEVKELIERILSHKRISSPIATKKYKNNLDDIYQIIYELLHNANHHGRRDVEQNEIPKSIRALSINIIDFSDIDKPHFLDNNLQYKYLLENVKKFLVVNIFDNGEGIVKKYIETLKRGEEADLLFNKRVEIFKETFLEGTTSSNIPNSGMGLTYVKKNIEKLHGSLLIKTGTLKQHLIPSKNGYNDDNLVEIPQCTGTLATIVIPLDIENA